jgi:hypothetical protein
MTQEEIFAQGGFAYGFALPHEKGNLDRFKVVSFHAEKTDDASKLCNKIIEGLGDKPVRLLLERAKQLKKLFDWYIERDFIIVIVINSAHLLNSQTIYDLKIMREFSLEPYRKSDPHVILLGNPDQIAALVDLHPGIRMRSSNLPARELRLIKW